MYTSSDGTKKNVMDMPTDYLINAKSKLMREIFYVKSQEEFDACLDNIVTLDNEIQRRIGNFLSEKIESEWK